TVTGGDGMVVQTGVKDGETLTYFSIQHLKSFTKIIDSNPDLLDRTRFQLEVDGTNFFDDKPIYDVEDINNDRGSAEEKEEIPFVTQYALNAVDPERFLVGTNYIYESEKGFDLGSLIPFSDEVETDLVLFGDTANGKVQPTTPSKVGEVQAIAYGGFFLDPATGQRTGKADVAYVGTKTRELYVKKGGAPGTNFVKTNWQTGPPAGAIPADVVLHPDDWRQVFVLGLDGSVWYGRLTDTVTDNRAVVQWTKLTGNLSGEHGLASNLKTIEVVKKNNGPQANNADDDTVVLLVGGQGGVFRATIDLSTIPAGGGELPQVWSELGANLPNVVVTDLHYDPTDDLLLAGTLGRG